MLRRQRKEQPVIEHTIDAAQQFAGGVAIAPVHGDDAAVARLGGEIAQQLFVGVDAARPFGDLHDPLLEPLEHYCRMSSARPASAAFDANKRRGHWPLGYRGRPEM